MTRHRRYVAALLTLGVGLLLAADARAGSWQNKFSFGSTLQGDLYTPTTPASPPAILVVVHMCTGHSTTVHGWFDSYADQQGFYLIAPDAGKQCFDSSASRDGDRAAIVTMVNYVLTNMHADPTRVFSAGMSSGGCMTNTLLAIYPDVFAGGSAMPGFPAGGWPAGDTTCTKCGSQPDHAGDGAYWGNLARSVFAWSGTYPCSQQWVGGGDEYNFDGWLPTVAAQFQNLGNLGSGMPGTGAPSGWTRTVYADSAGNVRLETNLGPTSQKHDLETVQPPLYGDVVRFLGLDKATGACGLTTTGSTSASSGGTASTSTSSMSNMSSTGAATTPGVTTGSTSSGSSTSTSQGSRSTESSATGTNGTSTSGGANSKSSSSSTTESSGSIASSDRGGCTCTTARGARGGALGACVAFAGALGVLARRRRYRRSAPMP
ncbi:MAG: prolyl oligopeptidase family serine peptidase [Polyangiaceae bacterium]|nr:prolyl oligopeptidase family serine peptidase [Polyangiaceae bacterium]